MRLISGAVLLLSVLLLNQGCTGAGNSKKDSKTSADTITVPDTGYTGIKQYFSGNTLIKEVTFKNGIRQGEMRSFYTTKEVRQLFWYENGLREDSAKWYYVEGPVFRATPYKRDTIHGIQQQYFKNGKIKARLGFEKGLRTFFFEEYTPDGKLITGYPDIVVSIKDDYKTNGTYRISLELSNKATKVKYFRGDFSKGVYDTARCEPVKTVNGTGILNLRKTSTPTNPNVEVLAEILTSYGNNYLLVKKIDLPYNDLK
ncbi:MAG: hypothetical protein A2X05_08545 [Bacteroidetes bacterium GWE2_41_25]|nr:MAG: hypothetical protein A2X03_17365 [Bacteroidetes bacterium GWA2_40_15]OFX98313.1 MAG: hypothetical protein A2X06_02690 [Bacteroidetes bacterium GWC2_40_22]OFY05045.1 MAG: hypothetical protein A2X05_08545 [Bacteroidetes bacterium GWE2_41_25]OFY57812.1 MAG: hypothetical protein A2X04_01255 [Bacteroidetes bacterium GWF2_41_9]HAM09822.1 hypothetical protein [Bacteroidales bacterium]